MSYNTEVYDELLERGEVLQGIDPLFDGIHNDLKKLKQTDPRSKLFRPHKIVNRVKQQIIDFIANSDKVEYIDIDVSEETDNTTDCEGRHILRPLNNGVWGCELCPAVLEVTVVSED